MKTVTEEEKKNLLFYSMDINDSSNLKERNDEQRYRAHIAVKDLHPVVPRTQGEDESRQKGNQADDAYRSEGKRSERGAKGNKIYFFDLRTTCPSS